MYKLTGISSAPYQKLTVPVPNDASISVILTYYPTQAMWFMDISWKDFVCNSIRLCYNPNLLRQFQHNITFGIGCMSDNTIDPTNIDSFSNGMCSLYLLDLSDIDTLENSLYQK